MKREPNGRASRKPVDIMKKLNDKWGADQREALRPGVEARHRIHKLDPKKAVDQKAGTFVGRMCLAGKLTDRQHEAAGRYLDDWSAMLLAVDGPVPASAIDLNRVHGRPGAENEAFSVAALAAWKGIHLAIQKRQNELKGRGQLFAALDYCVIRNGDFPHMLDWLREALDTLAAHYRLGHKLPPGKNSQRTVHPALTN